MNFLLKNCTIITSEKNIQGDILICNSKIAEIKNNISESPDDTEIIDTTGKYLFPGGIDAHVHFELPTPAGPSSDNFETGSIAAIYGGTTSYIDFVTPTKNESLISAFEKRLNEAKNSKTDFGFHMSITSWNKDTAGEMEICVKRFGIISFKTYMAYTGVIGIEEQELFEVMKVAAKLNSLVTVHCEMGNDILRKQKEFIAAGKISPKYHALSRSAECEARSVKNVISLAKKANCPVYIVHTSTEESLKHIENARRSGQVVYSETCPQYLLLDESLYDLPLPASLVYVISPPLRGKTDQQYLWNGLKNGSIQVVATDHCPFNLKGQKDFGIDDFTKIPNGAGGVEHRLSLLFTYGVLKNKISLNQFVALTSTNPAKIFGLYPKKGEIAVGSDADIVIWDPEKENIISAKTHHQHCDTNIYEGFRYIGKADLVFLKGQKVILNGKSKFSGIKGRYLRE